MVFHLKFQVTVVIKSESSQSQMLAALKNMQKDQILTMLGVILIKFSTGVITCWGSLNLYILSYLYHQGTSISPSTNSLIILFNVIPISFLILFATKLCHIFGYQPVIRLCGLLFFLSPFVVNLYFNTFVLVIFCILLPISCFAISSIPIINCLWTQFPKSKNKATALAVICFGIGGAFWNYLFTISVNPNNQTTTVKDPRTNLSFFGPEVAQRVLPCLKIGFPICGLFFLVGAWLIKKNTQYEDSTVVGGEIELEMMEINKIGSSSNNLKTIKPNNSLKNQKQPKNLKQALKDWRFILIFMISFFTGIYQIFLSTNLKIIYMPMVHNDIFLAYCAIVTSVSSIGGAFVWGYIGDKYNFYFLLLIFSILDFLIKLYGRFAVTETTIFVLFALIGFVDKAMLTIMGPGLVKIFGIDIATELLPYKGFSVFLGFLTAPLGYIILGSMVDPFQYLFILTIFSIFSVIIAFRLYRKYGSTKIV